MAYKTKRDSPAYTEDIAKQALIGSTLNTAQQLLLQKLKLSRGELNLSTTVVTQQVAPDLSHWAPDDTAMGWQSMWEHFMCIYMCRIPCLNDAHAAAHQW